MKENMKKALVIHPFLFALFPILSIFSHNVGELYLSALVTPIIVVICFTLLMFFILSLIIKDRNKTGIIVSLSLLLFFSYELLFHSAYSIIGEKITHGYVLVVCGIMLISGVYSTIKTRRNLRRLTMVLNLVAAFLVAMPAVRIAAFEAQHWLAFQDDESEETQNSAPDSDKPDKPPSIYYLILDGYGRADILKDIYQYDNSEFLNYLTQKGFYVANKSRSNYCQTVLSLSSSLNMKYQEDLGHRLIGTESDNLRPLFEFIKKSAVSKFLKLNGYVFVAFNSGISATNIEKADVYMAPGRRLSELQNTLINSTPAAFVLDKLGKKSQFDLQRERILFAFDQLASMTEKDSPLFVFAHIIAPHPPFVFGEDGEPVKPGKKWPSFLDGSDIIVDPKDRAEYIEGYKKQLTFVNKKVEETIDSILSKSPRPPIIILQADHGAGSMTDWKDIDKTNLKERMSIFNAYYLPHGGDEDLYPDITPVNTFRIIFNHYFGTIYELLEDESYYSDHKHPYKFINVTDKVVDSSGADSTSVPEPTE